jgi:RHH-type proline utilization regulon transcriptional repressor/proline dehydrogenase/delta 1-pyrroline-5-carboxylate dehydrogenase
LRVLCLQADVAERMLAMLRGAFAELRAGDPAQLPTDVGPVIDAEAQAAIEAHVARFAAQRRVLMLPLTEAQRIVASFVAPAIVELRSLDELRREVFGPVLHVLRWKREDLAALIDAINATGYGLTLGIHSRIDATVRYIHERLRVGNAYVNRNMIGAVVGVQPFGGEGLSGTGPKAGGPRYLHRFATERTLTIDTTAAGGNASLLSLQEEGG